jgi:FtsZ-interacting cell division protein ZipA
MEELKDKEEGAASEVPEGEASAGGKFRLTRRAMIIALSALAVLMLMVGGFFAYRASVQQEAAATQKKERLAREAAAEAAEREKAKAFAAESRRAHEALMAASPLAAELAPPPAKEADSQDGAKNPESAAKAPEPVSESAKTASPKPAPDAELAKAASAPGVAPASKAAAPAKTLEVSAPTAVGGCTVSGGRAEDYGKALGRCLEEFNRLEGRKP